MQHKPFYNTISLSGSELKQAVANAERQEEAIYLIYENTGKAYSPSKILELMQRAGKQWPITSCRRAITNLEKAGKLVKTETMVIGMYGKKEHQWIVKPDHHSLSNNKAA